jgi:hypothetical protein
MEHKTPFCIACNKYLSDDQLLNHTQTFKHLSKSYELYDKENKLKIKDNMNKLLLDNDNNLRCLTDNEIKMNNMYNKHDYIGCKQCFKVINNSDYQIIKHYRTNEHKYNIYRSLFENIDNNDYIMYNIHNLYIIQK